MATNKKGSGEVLYLVAPVGGVTSGTPVIIGGSFVLPLVTAAATVSFACVRDGEWYLTKATGFAPTAGDAAYWDSTSAHVEGTDATDNRRIGIFAKAAANGALVCYVIPDGVSFGDGDADLEAKANKVSGAVTGNLAGLSATGDLTDSGTKPADFVPDSLFDAQTILQATADNTPAALTVVEQSVVGRLTGGNISAVPIVATSAGAGDATKIPQLNGSGIIDPTIHGAQTTDTLHAAAAAGVSAGFITAADQTKLDGIEALADVTDETNVLAALATGATAKDMGGGAVTNVGLVDGVDVSAHGALHISTGADAVPNAVGAGASGLMTGADKTLLDAVVADFISAKAIISGDGNFEPSALASITADLPNAATTRAITFPASGGTWLLVYVYAVKTAANGGSGGAQTLTIQKAGNAITDAYDFQAVADGGMFDFPSDMDDAYTTFTDTDVLNMVTTKTGDSACRVTCIFQRIL
jgi:predicted RecA/RadA family phage recombinase